MVSVPLPPEDVPHVVDTLIGVICEEMGLTLQRKASQDRISPAATDSFEHWYYIQPGMSAPGQSLGLASDARPDLVLERDRASLGTDKFEQYSALGVPEVWCIDGNALHFFQLEDGTYVESDRSTAFPLVPVAEIPMFVEKTAKVGEQTVAKAFRAWSRMRIRENRGQNNPPPPPPLPPFNPLG